MGFKSGGMLSVYRPNIVVEIILIPVCCTSINNCVSAISTEKAFSKYTESVFYVLRDENT